MNFKIIFAIAAMSFVSTLSLVAAEEKFRQPESLSSHTWETTDGQIPKITQRTDVAEHFLAAAKLYGSVDVTEIQDVPLDIAINHIELTCELVNYEVALLNQLTAAHIKIVENFIADSLRESQSDLFTQSCNEISLQLFTKKEKGCFDKEEAKKLIRSHMTLGLMEHQNQKRKDFLDLFVRLLRAQKLVQQVHELQELVNNLEEFEKSHSKEMMDLTTEIAVLLLIRSFEERSHIFHYIRTQQASEGDEKIGQRQIAIKIDAQSLAHALDRARLLNQEPTDRRHQANASGQRSTADNVSGCQQQ